MFLYSCICAFKNSEDEQIFELVCMHWVQISPLKLEIVSQIYNWTNKPSYSKTIYIQHCHSVCAVHASSVLFWKYCQILTVWDLLHWLKQRQLVWVKIDSMDSFYGPHCKCELNSLVRSVPHRFQFKSCYLPWYFDKDALVLIILADVDFKYNFKE